MWFKKKSVLQAENHYDIEKSADGSTDIRTTRKYYYNNSSSINSGVPSTADAGNYFYLPALGMYDSGQLKYVGGGYYWSSSASPTSSNTAYGMKFFSSYVTMDGFGRNIGFRVGGLE